MNRRKSHGSAGPRLGLALMLAGVWLAAGCASLCNKHLALYRDTEAKGPSPAGQALVLTDPQLVQVVLPGSGLQVAGGLPWAPEQPSYETDYYRLSVDRVDGIPVYQGKCLDTTPTFSLEMRPGPRRLLVRLDLYGPGGHDKVQETANLNLEAGGVYFLYPDPEAARNRQLVLKVQRLPGAYDPGLRTRIMDWNRGHYPGRNLAD
jgi:hypothetical protein